MRGKRTSASIAPIAVRPAAFFLKNCGGMAGPLPLLLPAPELLHRPAKQERSRTLLGSATLLWAIPRAVEVCVRALVGVWVGV